MINRRDPFELIARYHEELGKQTPAWRERLFRQLGRRSAVQATGGEEPYFPCRWCQDRDVWGDDWPGYGCISLPEPMAA